MITYIHVPVPEEFFILSAAARLVWVGLCSFSSWKDGNFYRCFPGNAALVDRTGLSRSTIKRALHELVETGFIVRQLRFKGKLHLTSECRPGRIFGGDARISASVGSTGPDVGSTGDKDGFEKTRPSGPSEPQPLFSTSTRNHNQGDKEEAADPLDPLFLKVVELWNEILEPLGFSHHFATPLRGLAFAQRMKECPERGCVAWWEGLFERIAGTPFLVRGVKEGARWFTLDWLLREENLAKVLEGRYEGENHPHILRSRPGDVRNLDVEGFVRKMMRDPFWGGEDDDDEGAPTALGLS